MNTDILTIEFKIKGVKIMKKKILALSMVLLLSCTTLGSGLSVKAATCPPHSSSLYYCCTEQNGWYNHQYLDEIRYDRNGKPEYIYKNCLVCCETEYYSYKCNKCNQTTDRHAVSIDYEEHGSCGQ